MQKLLFRRTLRDMKTNFFRYMALLLLIILCMFIVVGTIGSAVSVIKTVNNKAEAARLEDGQFRVFVPLTETSLRNLENKGILLEECFHLDFLMEDGSTLRIMKNRETINLAELSEGSLAHAPGEIVVERLYAAAHDLSLGDTLQIGGSDFAVTGIGTSADYEYCLQNMSDMSSDGKVSEPPLLFPTPMMTCLPEGKPFRRKNTVTAIFSAKT